MTRGREFIVALRNDQHQLLVLEDEESNPVFPGGVLTEDPLPKVISQRVREDTGLLIGGLHLTSVGKDRPNHDVYRYTAHVAGGVLTSFPTPPRLDRDPPTAGFQSGSWLSPSLVPRVAGASRDMVELVRDLSNTLIRAPRP